MAGAIGILVKTPGYSDVKTRLAAHLGKERAEAFFRLSVAAVEATVKEFLEVRTDWHAYWYVVERKAVKDPQWSGLPARHAGRGDLGMRMARMYEQMRSEHGRAIVLGGDSPQITSSMLHAVWFITQVRQRPVIGPANDGGFYLIGGRDEIPTQVWTRTPYSQGDTRGRLIEEMGKAGLGDPFLLNTLSDVDDLADLVHAVREMPEDPTPAQQTLIDWVRALK